MLAGVLPSTLLLMRGEELLSRLQLGHSRSTADSSSRASSSDGAASCPPAEPGTEALAAAAATAARRLHTAVLGALLQVRLQRTDCAAAGSPVLAGTSE